MRLRERIDHTATLLTGMALGAGIMYIFDEQSGGLRRAWARDKMVRATHASAWWTRRQARDLGNRALGSMYELRSSLRDRGREIPDDVLRERVRTQLGHVVSHPGSLDV